MSAMDWVQVIGVAISVVMFTLFIVGAAYIIGEALGMWGDR